MQTHETQMEQSSFPKTLPASISELREFVRAVLIDILRTEGLKAIRRGGVHNDVASVYNLQQIRKGRLKKMSSKEIRDFGRICLNTQARQDTSTALRSRDMDRFAKCVAELNRRGEEW